MNFKALSLNAALGAGIVLGCAYANENPDTDTGEYLYTLPFYLEADDDREVDDGAGFAIGYGRRWTGNLFWGLQGFATALDTDRPDLTDFYQYGGGLDLSYHLSRDGFIPFGLIGLGGVHNNVVPNSDDDTSIYGNAGIGLLSPAADNGLRLRLEARYIYDTFEFAGSDNMGDWRIGLGLQVPLGRKTATEREIVEREVVKTVPADISDSDGDGVPDQNDECPNTLKGLSTNSVGCAAQSQTVTLKDVQFELDSADLLPSAERTLQGVVEALEGEPGLRVEIAGHTDDTGPDAYNLRLSRERAAAVRQYLIDNGIAAHRLRSNGYGESQPIASNNTFEGREKNRRVEFRVLGGS